MMTAAAIDRLVHHSVIIELNIPSYRVEHACKEESASGKPGRKRMSRQAQKITNNGAEKSYGNAGAVESLENQPQVFHPFHPPPLEISQHRRDFHIPTAPIRTSCIYPKQKTVRLRASPWPRLHSSCH